MSTAAQCLATIDRLYAALHAGDGEAMAACYTTDATFEDPAFGRLTGGAGQDMWRMLTARAGDLRVELVARSVTADATAGTAHWQADYTFTETGRKVHNDVHAAFVFRDGLIAEHRDDFDLRAWGGQALGPVGTILGLTPLLKVIIRRKTSGQLKTFRAAR